MANDFQWLGSLIPGGMTVGILAAGIRLYMKALKDEQIRYGDLADDVRAELAEQKALYNTDREAWRQERNFLLQEISDLRGQVADLYRRLYQS